MQIPKQVMYWFVCNCLPTQMVRAIEDLEFHPWQCHSKKMMVVKTHLVNILQGNILKPDMTCKCLHQQKVN